MERLIPLFNKKRQHFKNRLKLRKGRIIYLLFAKRLPNKYKRQDGVKVYQYKNHIYFIENNRLQTYINKSISRAYERRIREENRKAK